MFISEVLKNVSALVYLTLMYFTAFVFVLLKKKLANVWENAVHSMLIAHFIKQRQ